MSKLFTQEQIDARAQELLQANFDRFEKMGVKDLGKAPPLSTLSSSSQSGWRNVALQALTREKEAKEAKEAKEGFWVRCVDASDTSWLTEGKEYRVEGPDIIEKYLLVKDDGGVVAEYKSTRFKPRQVEQLQTSAPPSEAQIERWAEAEAALALVNDGKRSHLPSGAAERKAIPVASGFFDYFPDAIVAVAALSKVGNDQHNPGKPLHWDRSKSQDEADTLARHFLDRGTFDTDGVRHSTKVAWRALALLQKELEAAHAENRISNNDTEKRIDPA